MTEEERLSILKWFATKQNNLHKLSMNRADYKININDNDIPIAIWRIKKRINEIEGLKEYTKETKFQDIVTVVFKGGGIHHHIDPNWIDGRIHTRFNVFLQVPQNFRVYYAGQLVEAKESHYVMCRSGLDYHWSNTNTEDTPRIALSFGYMLPISKIDEIYKPTRSYAYLEDMKQILESNILFKNSYRD